MPLFRNTRFDDEAQELRNKLLMWYFNHYELMQANIGTLEDAELAEKLFGADAKDISSRIKEVLIPLTLVGQASEISKLGTTLDAKLKGIDQDYFFQMQIKDAMNRLIETKEALQYGNEYWVNVTKLSNELLLMEADTEDVAWQKITREDLRIKSRELMKLLTAELGFNFKIKKKIRYVMIPASWLGREEWQKL